MTIKLELIAVTTFAVGKIFDWIADILWERKYYLLEDICKISYAMCVTASIAMVVFHFVEPFVDWVKTTHSPAEINTKLLMIGIGSMVFSGVLLVLIKVKINLLKKERAKSEER